MKNVLFITYDFPFPVTSGGKNRAYHMLKYGGDHKKYLLSFIREDFKKEYLEEMEKIGVEVVGTIPRRKVASIKNLMGLAAGESIFKALYYSEDTLREIISIIREKKIDVVHFESYYTGFFIGEKLKSMGVAQVFGTENIEHQIYKNYAKSSNFLLFPFLNNQVKKIKREEEKMFRDSDACIAVSDSEATYIRKFSTCEIVRNGVDIESLKFRMPQGDGKKLLFVGNFVYFPNVDAINYFYNEVFKNLPNEFTLTVIGKKANSLGFGNNNRVILREFIPEISDAYYNNDILVSPVRLGGGTNFKIIEAMAAGLPVVALPDNLSGLDVKDGVNIIIAKDSKDYGEAIIKLAKDLDKRKSIALSARKLVEDNYSWENIGKVLAYLWEKI